MTVSLLQSNQSSEPSNLFLLRNFVLLTLFFLLHGFDGSFDINVDVRVLHLHKIHVPCTAVPGVMDHHVSDKRTLDPKERGKFHEEARSIDVVELAYLASGFYGLVG
jgi:hypothetical protein